MTQSSPLTREPEPPLAPTDLIADLSSSSLSDPLNDPILLREWFLVAWSSELAPGQTLARRVLGRDLVLWRSAEGLHCWLDLCVHRGAKLSLGQVRQQGSGCLVCPYHAWEYAPSGQCTRMPAHPEMIPPAKAHATVFQACEAYGAIWISLSNDPAELPDYPFAETPGFRIVRAGPYRFRAQGPRVIENALDVAHLGYVHAGLLGDLARLEIADYDVSETPQGPQASEIRIWQPNPDGTGKGAHATYRYWVSGPLTMGIEKTTTQSANDGRRFGILAQVIPIDTEFSEMRLLMTMNYGHEIPSAELRAFQDRVTEQDRAIVESQRPELLPLDLQAELHLRSDRMAIAYRKWLRKIGLRYGTA